MKILLDKVCSTGLHDGDRPDHGRDAGRGETVSHGQTIIVPFEQPIKKDSHLWCSMATSPRWRGGQNYRKEACLHRKARVYNSENWR